MAYNEMRLQRIITECLEVSLVICNSDLEEFTVSKVFDIFDQTLATAHILNTGYWPFFSSNMGQSLCCCGRFGFKCRHVRNSWHWIDLSPMPSYAGQQVFRPRYYGALTPVDYRIVLKPLSESFQIGYDINMLIKLQYKPPRYRANMRMLPTIHPTAAPSADIYNEVFTMQIMSCYHLSAQFYQANATVIFHPNPFFHRCYASLFGNLMAARQIDPELEEMSSQVFCWSTIQMPPSTFFLRHTNMPMNVAADAVAAYFVMEPTFAPRPVTYDKNRWGSYHAECIMRHGLVEDAIEIVDLSHISLEGTDGIDVDAMNTVLPNSFSAPAAAPGYNSPFKDKKYSYTAAAAGAVSSTSGQDEPVSSTSDLADTVVVGDASGKRAKKKKISPIRRCQNKVNAAPAIQLEDVAHEKASSTKIPSEAVEEAAAAALQPLLKTKKEYRAGSLEWFNANFPPLQSNNQTLSFDERMEMIDSVIRADCAKDKPKNRVADVDDGTNEQD